MVRPPDMVPAATEATAVVEASRVSLRSAEPETLTAVSEELLLSTSIELFPLDPIERVLASTISLDCASTPAAV